MTDKYGNGLSYGHFGDAIYDPEDQEWSFTRQSGSRSVLSPLGEPRLLYKPTPGGTAQHDDYSDTSERNDRRHDKQIQVLAKRFPEIQPAASFLRPLLSVSEAINAVALEHDPVKGSLLAFGRASSESVKKFVPVAALACGPTGSDVHILQLTPQRRWWDQDRSVYLEALALAGKGGTWHGEGAPVQQINFAQPLESSETLLAVRFLTRTMVFRPVVRKVPRPGETSLLDTILICTLYISETGGLSHADVTFNPWFQNQVAIVDQQGNWSVWELPSMRSKSVQQGKLINRDTLRNGVSEAERARYDGWARISWSAEISMLAVCTRRALILVDISSAPPVSKEIALDLGPTSWILDMQVASGNREYLFVLTSTHVGLLRISSDKFNAPGKALKPIVRTAAAWRHWRNAEDVTMRMTLFQDETDIVVLLRSSFIKTVSSFRFSIDDGTVVAHDPADLDLPAAHDSDEKIHSCMLELRVQRMDLHSNQVAGSDSLGRLYCDRDVRFYTATMLRSDLSIWQTLYYASPPGRQQLVVEQPRFESKIRLSAPRVTNEDFVVDDHTDVDIVQEASRARPKSRFQQRRLLGRADRSSDAWTVSFERLCRELEDLGRMPAEDISEILQRAKDALNERGDGTDLHVRTLLDLAQSVVGIEDIDTASRILDETIQLDDGREPQDEPSQSSQLRIRQLNNNAMAILPDGANTLASAYDRAVDRWIAPLSERIPGRVRVAKEQLVRRMIADVVLARHILEPLEQSSQEQESLEATQSQTQSQSRLLGLTVPAVASGSQAQPASSLVLLTPSPTATPSVTTASSRPSSFAAPEVARLSRYAKFTKPPPSALSRPLTNILSHWQPGTDPSTYDWLATSSRIAQQDDEADEELTTKQRARVQRRAERHLRRQRREAEASRVQAASSSQLPGIAISSQVPAYEIVDQRAMAHGGSQPAVVTAGSSQSQGIGRAAASQVEPGRFGGRPPTKKKRKQGF